MLGIIGVLAGTVNCADCDTVNRIGVSVEITVVTVGRTVSAGKDVDGAKATTTLLHSLEHCSSNEDIGGLHGLSIVGGAPGARVNIVILDLVHQSFSLVRVADGLAQDSDTGDPGVVGNAYTTHIVTGSGHFTGATSSMSVVRQLRLRFSVAVVKVVGTFCEVVVLEVIAVHIQSIVDDRHSCIPTSNAFKPQPSNVDVVAQLNRVEQMPLLFEDWISDVERLHNLSLLLKGLVSKLQLSGAKQRIASRN